MARRLFAMVAALALMAAACGDEGAEVGVTSARASSTTITTTTAASVATSTTSASPTTPASPTTTEPLDIGEVWIGNTATLSTAIEGDVAYSGELTDLRSGEHPGYTRIVFDFTEDGAAPGYLVGYREGPFLEPSGDTVPVEGNAFVYVSLFPARTVDFESEDQTPTYLGPRRFSPEGANVSEMVFISDFEATMEWVVGVDRVGPIRVFTLDGPPRVVVDIADGPGVFFMNTPNFDIGVEPYRSAVLRDLATPQDALAALFDGPSAAEEAAGLALVASEAAGAELVSVESGVAVVRLQGGCNGGGSTFTVADLIASTLRQFPDIDFVKILDPDGRTADRNGPGDSIPGCLEP